MPGPLVTGMIPHPFPSMASVLHHAIGLILPTRLAKRDTVSGDEPLGPVPKNKSRRGWFAIVTVRVNTTRSLPSNDGRSPKENVAKIQSGHDILKVP